MAVSVHPSLLNSWSSAILFLSGPSVGGRRLFPPLKLFPSRFFIFRCPCAVIATNAFTECLEFSRVANPSINGFLMHGHKFPTSRSSNESSLIRGAGMSKIFVRTSLYYGRNLPTLHRFDKFEMIFLIKPTFLPKDKRTNSILLLKYQFWKNVTSE